MKAILITGSRRLTDPDPIHDELDEHLPDLVIEGGAAGADYFALKWAQNAGIARLHWPDQHWGGPPDLTGPQRNGHMVNVAAALKAAGWAVEVHAYPDNDSRGTWDCVRQADKAGLDVFVHHDYYDEEADPA